MRKELDALRSDYEERINLLELRIRELESTPSAVTKERHDGATEMRAGEQSKDEALVAAEKREADALALQQAMRRAVDKRFEENTETRDFAGRSGSGEIGRQSGMENVLQGYVDITGYFRSGYGRANEGGAQQAFGIPGVSKYRLGNEAENYGELAFAKTFFPAGVFSARDGINPDDPVARMVYRLSTTIPIQATARGLPPISLRRKHGPPSRMSSPDFPTRESGRETGSTGAMTSI